MIPAVACFRDSPVDDGIWSMGVLFLQGDNRWEGKLGVLMTGFPDGARKNNE